MDLDQPSYQAPDYLPVDRGELRDYTKARIRVFHEEELDVPLVLFDQVLDHVLRIDRILRQPQGHLRSLQDHVLQVFCLDEQPDSVPDKGAQQVQ